MNKVVLQCLYSQCQSTVFGSALHQTLAACPGSALDALDTLPPLIRHQGLRKRNNVMSIHGAHSASVSVSTSRKLARRSAAGSVVRSARPTRSVPYLVLSKTHSTITSYSTTFATSTSISKPAFTFEFLNSTVI